METVTTQPRMLVVGGASGIGAACVEHLAASGAAVLCADLKAPPPTAPIQGFAEVDVRDPEAVGVAVARLADGRPIDGMVYAAGLGQVAPVDEISPKRWQLVIDVNLSGAFYCARAVLPHLAERSAFVFISSIDSVSPVSGLAHYCASKAGVEALSRSLALELAARGVRSNVVAPGPVSTPLMEAAFEDHSRRQAFVSRTPLGVIADPMDVANVVAFLLSSAAQHVTGARLAVDGGMSLREHPSMLTTTQGPA